MNARDSEIGASKEQNIMFEVKEKHQAVRCKITDIIFTKEFIEEFFNTRDYKTPLIETFQHERLLRFCDEHRIKDGATVSMETDVISGSMHSAIHTWINRPDGLQVRYDPYIRMKISAAKSHIGKGGRISRKGAESAVRELYSVDDDDFVDRWDAHEVRAIKRLLFSFLSGKLDQADMAGLSSRLTALNSKIEFYFKTVK